MTKYIIKIESGEDVRKYEFNTPELYSLGSNHDEIHIKEGKLSVTKNIRKTEYNKYYIDDNPETYDVEITAIETDLEGLDDALVLFKGHNKISIETLRGDIFLTFMIDSPFADGLATKMDLRAGISLVDDQINMKVSKGEIISEINLSSEEAKIQADKISLEGYTTINDGFSIDLDGNMTCNDAIINGGLVVEDGLYACLTFTPTVSAEFWEDYSSIGGLQKVGYFLNSYGNYSPARHYRVPVVIPFNLPDGFEITEANLFVEHQTVRWDGGSISKAEGLRVYVNELPPQSSTSINISVIYGQEAVPLNQYLTNQVTGVWADGSTGKTFANGYRVEKTRDIANSLRGMQNGTVAIAPVTAYVSDYRINSSLLNAKLYIYGYLKRGQ